jgi:segregation and condensation protein A
LIADSGHVPYRIALPEFEGPLDLLLHLCKTHELDIVNIPIAFVTEKYLEELERMQDQSVDVAADYLVMAATLAYLKSRELVPTPEPLELTGEDGEPEIDPRQELIRRLLEYQKYKDAAEKLSGRPIEGRTVFLRGVPIEVDADSDAPFAEQSVWKLIAAFGKLLEKAGGTHVHDVLVDRISIGDRINQIVDRLEAHGGSFRFDSCFDLTLPEAELRNQIVVTLLAILELARLKVVRVLAAETDGVGDDTLFIAQVTGASLDAARRVEVTSAHEAVGSAAEATAEPAPTSEGANEETQEP